MTFSQVKEKTKRIKEEIGNDILESEKAHNLVKENETANEKVETYGTDFNFKREIVWKNVFVFAILHLLGIYAFYLCFVSAKRTTLIYNVLVIIITGQGITMGAHRYFTHRAFKVKPWLKLALLLCHTAAGQNCMYVWVRDHRQHHKYSDTDADPHNARRGFFFAHIGWLMSKKHPLVIEKGKTIDMSDMKNDKLIMWQKKYYYPLYLIFAVFIPVSIPVCLWNETIWNSFFITYIARYVYSLHITWLVNSYAHFYGTKPFDKNILPVETFFVSFFTVGEGWHNYHHCYPYDYRASEFGSRMNITTAVIDFFAYLGWIYDRKQATDNMIRNRILRTGDGTHYAFKYLHDDHYSDHSSDQDNY